MVFRDRTYGVLLVSPSAKFHTATRELLPPGDFWPVESAGSESEARRKLAFQSFDVVLIDTPLPDGFGSGLACELCESGNAGVLLFVAAERCDEVYYKVLESGVCCLAKPTNARMVSQQLRVLCAMRERLRRFEEKQQTVEEKIAEIRLVNRAKWHLIETRGMSEEEAHKFLEQQAMDLRRSRREIAEAVLREGPRNAVRT